VRSPGALGLPSIPVGSPRAQRGKMGTRVERIPTDVGMVGAEVIASESPLL